MRVRCFVRVYLDNCCFKRPYDKQVRPDVIAESRAVSEVLELVDNNKVELVASFISILENKRDPRPKPRIDTLNHILKASTYISSAAPVSAIAKQLAESLDAFDAIHVACAIAAHCDYFLTTDKRVLQLKDARIITMNPVNFASLWKEGSNDNCRDER